MPDKPKPDSDAVNTAYSRLIQYADKLFEAAVDLEAGGGISQIANLWKPKAIDRAANVLTSARDALDEQLEAINGLGLKPLGRRLDARRKPKGGPPGPRR
jgi:hypothetical protein